MDMMLGDSDGLMIDVTGVSQRCLASLGWRWGVFGTSIVNSRGSERFLNTQALNCLIRTVNHAIDDTLKSLYFVYAALCCPTSVANISVYSRVLASLCTLIIGLRPH